jgi:hypothetical protein
VAVLAIISALIVPREDAATPAVSPAEIHARNKSQINAAVQKFFRDTGVWPRTDLSDVGRQPKYFPQGLPTNPFDPSQPYAIDEETHRVEIP